MTVWALRKRRKATRAQRKMLCQFTHDAFRSWALYGMVVIGIERETGNRCVRHPWVE